MVQLLVSRAHRRDGASPRALEQGTRMGRFVRIRPGVYVSAEEWRETTSAERHRAAVDALLAVSRRPPVFSHESAAALAGMPLIGEWPAIAAVTVDPGSSRRTRVRVRTYRARLCDGDVEIVDGVPRTSAARTAHDLSASRPLELGVGAWDFALRSSGPAARETWEARIRDARPARGAAKALTALAVATGESESPFESLSLARFWQLGVARPEQQVEFDTGTARYRADFFWPEFGVIGESDGRGKYTDLDSLWREKLREDALRSLPGIRTVVRWSWADAWQRAPLATKLQRAGLPRHPRSANRSA